jgi:hypothetical protein
MSVKELMQSAMFLSDSAGNTKGVLLNYGLWNQLLSLLEDIEDAEEIKDLKNKNEEVISWEEAKAQLRQDGIDVSS